MHTRSSHPIKEAACRRSATSLARAFNLATAVGVSLMSDRRKLATERLVGTIAEHVVSLHQFVNFARALVDDGAFRVSIKASDGVLIGVSVGAVYLHRIRCGTFGCDGRKPFRQAGLTRIALADILEPCRAEPQQSRRLIIRLHLRDHFLHELMLPDLDAEGLSLA